MLRSGRGGFLPHLLTVLGATAIAIAWAVLILAKSESLPTTGDGYEVNVVVPTSALLSEGARVTVAGVEVGDVRTVERTASGRGVRLRLRVTDDRVVPVPRDSRVQVRTRSQVGENYVAIVVGRAADDLASGEYLTADRADEHVAVDEVLSVLQGRTKTRARELFAGLGEAVEGRADDVNRTARGFAQTVDSGEEIVALAYRDREVVARLVDQLGRVAGAVGERGAAIDTIARRGLVSLRAVGDRDAALAETLREFPSTLDRVRDATRTVSDVSRRSTPVVANLAAATREARPVVRRLRPAADEGRRVVSALGTAAPPLRAAIATLDGVTGPLAAAFPELRGALCQVNPVLRHVLPYKDDLIGPIVGLGSASNSYDATGHLVRLSPIMSDNSLSGAPKEVNDAAATLVNSGLLSTAKLINYDPHTGPGRLGKTRAVPGGPHDPETLTAAGYRYPRVTADC
jgi:phospholipid/cholesterol/gamma-HCH transport system substrate-binding protein